jgi:glycerol uptake facilitator-like aquaporin
VLTKKLIAEFVGTCFLVMIVVGSGIMAQNLSSDLIIILLANTIATGAGLTALMWIFITVSGAHFNPAVTLSRAFTDTFTGINYEFILPFIIFQLFGALSAMFMMKLIQRDN